MASFSSLCSPTCRNFHKCFICKPCCKEPTKTEELLTQPRYRRNFQLLMLRRGTGGIVPDQVCPWSTGFFHPTFPAQLHFHASSGCMRVSMQGILGIQKIKHTLDCSTKGSQKIASERVVEKLRNYLKWQKASCLERVVFNK